MQNKKRSCLGRTFLHAAYIKAKKCKKETADHICQPCRKRKSMCRLIKPRKYRNRAPITPAAPTTIYFMTSPLPKPAHILIIAKM